MTDLSILTGAGGGGSKQKPPVEAKNTLQATSKGKLLDLIQYGQILGLAEGMKSVYLGGTPLRNDDGTSNFEGIRVQFREGLPNQSIIEGFRGAENIVDVSTEVEHGKPVVRSLTNNVADAAIVTVQLSALYKQDDKGNTNPHQVTVEIAWRVNQGPWRNAVNDTIKGKTMSPYPRSYRIDFEGSRGSIDLRVSRLSPDDPDSKSQSVTTWTLFNEVIDRKFSYPDMALVGIEIDAQEFGNSIPERTYDMFLSIIKVPSNYDPLKRTYTGLWDGTFKNAWSNNPAWVFYDVATDPVFGADIPYVDKWSLYAIGQYCDQLVPDGYGGMEPRFTFNSILSGEEDAITALNNIASVFRGMVYWGSNSVVAVADMPEDPTLLVTPANSEGDFSYSETSESERHSVAVVMFNDPEQGHELTPVVYEDPASVREFGWREVRATAVGCTSRGQALRLAKWILYSERNETETLSYTASIDHAMLRPGMVIQVADPNRAGARLGGRVLVTSNLIPKLDKIPEDLPVGTWFFSVAMPDGTIARREITEFLADGYIRLKTALPDSPIPGAVWVISALDLRLPEFRVTSVAEDGDRYSVTATQYDRNKYDIVELGLEIEETPNSLIPQGPISAPGAIVYRTEKYLAGGTEHQKLVISWEPSGDPRVTRYLLEVQGPGEVTWRTVHSSPGTIHEELDSDSGRWLIRVRAENSLGAASQWVQISADIVGLLVPPVPMSVEVISGPFSITLRPQGVDFNAQYEFWRSSVALLDHMIESNAQYLTTAQYLVDTELEHSTTYYYYIRGVNFYGVSAWFPVQASTSDNIDDILNELSGQLREHHLYDDLAKEIEKISAPAWVEGSVDQRLQQARDEIGGEVEGLGDALGLLDEARQALDDRISGIDDSLEDLGERTGAIDTSVGSLTEGLDALEQAVSGIDTSVNDLTEDLDQRSEALTDSISDLGERADNLEIGVDDLGYRLEKQGEESSAAFTLLSRIQEEEDTLRAIEIKALEARSQGNQAGIINESVVSISRDEVLATDISALGVDLTTAKSSLEASIAEERTVRGTALEAEATSRNQLAAQLRGDYSGSDLSSLSSGLLFQERQARVMQGEAFTEQLSLISAGVGEQFDPLKMEHFDSEDSLWTGGTLENGWLVPASGTGTYVQSPNGIGAVGAKYSQVRLRVRRVGDPDWAGVLSWRAVGSSSWTDVVIEEPTYDLNGIGLITINPEWSGEVDQVRVYLAQTQSASTGFSLDWLAIGRPSPGASSASLAELQQATASAQAAETQARESLSAVLTGVTSPEGLELENLSSGLLHSERVARVTEQEALAQSITDMRSEFGEDLSSAITDVNTAWSNADQALTQQITTAQSTADSGVTKAEAAQDAAQAASDLAGGKGQVFFQTAAPTLSQRLPQNLWIDTSGSANTPKRWNGSAWVAVTDKVATDAAAAAAAAQAAVNTLDARVTQEVSTLTAADLALTQQVTTAQSTADSGVSKAEAAQGAAQSASDLAGGKGKVFFQASAPAVAERLAQNLWIDTTSGNNTPKRWDGSRWAPVTDKVATDAAAAAAAAQAAVNTLDARVTQEVSTLADADQALTLQVTTAQSTASTAEEKADEALDSIDTLDARVTNEVKTLADADQALTVQVSTAQSTAESGVSKAEAAQSAAQNAADLAGGKGRVFFQDNEPTADDRSAQNLWIDTTENNNTPKRWDGGKWVAVTDKVALDAAAAAAAAHTSLTTLDARVTEEVSTLVSADQALTQQVTTAQSTADSGVSKAEAAQGAAQSASDLAGGKGKVFFQADAPASAERLAQNLWIDTTEGANTPKRWDGSEWAAVTDKVATDAAAAASEVAGQVSTLDARVTEEVKTLADADQAITQMVTEAQSTADSAIGVTASFREEIQTLAENDRAQAARQTGLESAVGENSAGLDSLSRVVVESNHVQAIESLALEARTQGNQANIMHTRVAMATEDEALAQEISQLGVKVGEDISAAITQVNTAWADADSALTQQITSAQSTADSGVSKAEAAQTAAQSASDLAGGKGKVFFQADAPASAERLAQNLWIDTTGGANTPKRWDGSKWAAVTDKVATDAAAAAAAAASQVTTLDARVTEEVSTLVAADQALTQQVTTAQSTAESGVSKAEAAQTAAQSASDLAGGKGKVFFQASAPATAERLAQNLWIDTTGGANTPKRWDGSKWAAVTDKVATDAAEAAAAIASQVTTLDARVTEEVSTLVAADQALAQLITTAQTTAESVVTKAEAAQSAAQSASDLAGGKGKVFFQVDAPASAERLAQNLWIDTTDGNNTPKRWDGSKWAAVTDKVATDAAEAAEAAEAYIKEVEARVTQQITTLANADQARAESITDMESAIGDTVAQVTDLVAATALAGNEARATAEAVRRLDVTTSEVSGNIQAIQRVSSENEVMMAIQHAAIEAHAGSNRAGIFVEQTVRSDENSSIVEQISTLQARVEDDIAAILEELYVEVGPEGSLAKRIDTVSATAQLGVDKAEDAQDAADAAQSSAAEADLAAANAAYEAQQASNLAGGKGKVFFQNTAPATAERLPQNLWIDTTSGNNTPKRWNGSAWAAVTDKVATAAAAAAAAAQSAVTTLDARVTNEVKAITGPNGAIATQISTVQSALGRQIASVQTLAQTGVTALNKVEAMYAVRVASDGYVSGFGLSNNGTQSVFAVRANRFYIARPGVTDSQVLPFAVVDGQVYMRAAMIQEASITSAKIRDASINSAKIASYIQSTNYSSTAGWRINKSGSAIFNDVTVRRQLQRATGTVSLGTIGTPYTSGWTETFITIINTGIPTSAWSGPDRTMQALISTNGGSVSTHLNSNQGPNVGWAFQATVYPVTHWSSSHGTTTIHLRVTALLKYVEKLQNYSLRWRLYELT